MTNSAPSFNVGDGTVVTPIGSLYDSAFSVTLQPDGRILVAGEGRSGSGNTDFALARYNADGSLDTSFGGGDGIVTTPVGAFHDSGRSMTLQPDGRILVTGFSESASGNYDFALVRYNADGALDTSFGGGNGIVTSPIGSSDDYAYSVTLQPDGRILVAGESRIASGGFNDFAVVRYNADGSLDTSFGGGDGFVTTPVGASFDIAYSMALQPDGCILVAGSNENAGGDEDIALVRYNANGTLDTSFGGGDGIVTTPIGTSDDSGRSVTLQPDGRILVAGASLNASGNYDFALVRYNTDGTLDTSFGFGRRLSSGDGIVTTPIGASFDYASSVMLQPDGRILVAGVSVNASGNSDFALVRYNADGSLDTSFGGGDGIVTTPIGPSAGTAYSMTLQPDGRILVAGVSVNASGNDDFALVRYNADGSLDTSFDGASSLGGTAAYVENGAPVRLDADVQVSDAHLDQLSGGGGDYSGASLVLARQGGAIAQDSFGFLAGQGFTVSGSSLQKTGGQTFATFTSTGGTLSISFVNGGAVPSTALVNQVLRAITYANSADAPPSSVTLLWSFSDGNTGAQGTGGALSATGTTNVTITGVNDAPVARNDAATTLESAFVTIDVLGGAGSAPDSDPDGDSLRVVSVAGQAIASGGSVTLASGAVVTLLANGQLRYDPSGAFNSLPGPASGASNTQAQDTFGYGVSDNNGGSASASVTVTIVGQDSSGDVLNGTNNTDVLDGGLGSDTLHGLGGTDFLVGGAGDDTLDGGDDADILFYGPGADTHIGGGGIDYMTYANVTAVQPAGTTTLRIDLTAPAVNAGLALGDTFSGVEAFFLSQGDDLFAGDATNNFIFGQNGNDVIASGGGGDIIYGEGGNDFISTGALSSIVVGGSGADTFYFGLNQVEQEQILDFEVGTDKIALDDVGFNLVGQTIIAGFNFISTTTALGASYLAGQSTLIFYSDIDQLYADTDGAGGAAANLLAVFGNNPNLTASDFAIL